MTAFSQPFELYLQHSDELDEIIIDGLPAASDFEQWLSVAQKYLPANTHANAPQSNFGNEITIRIVDSAESQALNSQYREKDKPTNVLSFGFELPPWMLDADSGDDDEDERTDFPLGDLIICAEVVAQEAEAQGKNPMHHWAHMTLHGLLHLLGYDHIDEEDAKAMETVEINLLKQLNINNPYDSSD